MKKFLVLVGTFFLLISGFAQIPTANLLAYYPFCGNATDFSGNGYNGTVMGASLSPDRFGNLNSAYDFNGINNYINLPPAAFTNLNIYSVSLWMKPTSNVNGANIAYSVGTGSDLYCMSINYNPPNIFTGSYNVGTNPVQSYVISTPVAGVNNWYHVVVTRNSSNLKLYVNGVLQLQLSTANTNNQAVDYGASPYRAVIGCRSIPQDYFPGQIDDIRIYTSVITQNDVNALFNETPFSISVNSGSICSGSSFQLNPTGASSYTFSGGSSLVSPSTSSNYTVSAMSSVGCLASAVASVIVNQAAISLNSGTICNGSSFQLNPVGAASYTISGGSFQVSPSLTTSYSVTGTSNTGCQAFAVATVVVNETPSISVSSGTICRGDSFHLNPQGAASFTLPRGSPVVSPVSSTSYTVWGANIAGCRGSAVSNVIVNPCTGLRELQAEDKTFVIFPNPHGGNFMIKFKEMPERNSQFIIKDLQGRTIKVVEIDGTSNEVKLCVSLLTGCYIGEWTVGGKTICSRKICNTQ